MNKELPYCKVAREVLITRQQMNSTIADSMIEESNIDEIEQQINAKNSILNALDSLANQLKLSNDEDLQDFIYNEENDGSIKPIVLGAISAYIERFNSARTEDNLNSKDCAINYLIMNMLEAVHNGWIKNNKEAFFFIKKIERTTISIFAN